MKKLKNLIANGKQFLIDSYSIYKSKQVKKMLFNLDTQSI